MPRVRARNAPALLLAAGVVLLAGCGATAEPGSEKFHHEHSAEAARVAASIGAVSSGVAGLGAAPSAAALDALAVGAHRARRSLLAAAGWTVTEDGEEEGVSQAEREIHEGTDALLRAMTDLRLYTEQRSPAALAAYRRELAGGREYWNQGITHLWYLAKRPAPPRIERPQ